MTYEKEVIEEILENALEKWERFKIENLKGFAPKEFTVLKKHEKSYIAKKE